MDDVRWARFGALGGVLFVILLVISGVLSGSPPALDDRAREFVDYFADHDTELAVAAYLDALAIVPILFWLGSLWRRMRIAEDGRPRLAVVAVGGLVLAASFGIAASVVLGATALRVDGLEPETVKAFYTLSVTLDAASAVGLATLIAAVSALVLRTGMFPRWLGWAGEVLALAALVAGAGTATENGAIAVVGAVVFTLFLLWVLVVSILLFRAKEPGTPAAGQAAPAAG